MLLYCYRLQHPFTHDVQVSDRVRLTTENCLPFGYSYPVDIDQMETLWNTHGHLVLYYTWVSPESATQENVYYLIVESPLPQTKTYYEVIEPVTQKDTAEEQTTGPFLFLFMKRFSQRLRTRKIIKEYTKEAQRRATYESQPHPYTIQSTLLERAMQVHMEKGEELYWFREYERGLLEIALQDTKWAMEDYQKTMEIIGKQSC
jgi:hypothetical protein